MKNFEVIIREERVYSINVEAADRDAAETAAYEKLGEFPHDKIEALHSNYETDEITEVFRRYTFGYCESCGYTNFDVIASSEERAVELANQQLADGPPFTAEDISSDVETNEMTERVCEEQVYD